MMKNLSAFASALAVAAASMLSTPNEVAAEWNDPFSVSPGTVEVAFLQLEPSGVYVNFKTTPFSGVNCTSGVSGSVVWWKLGGGTDNVNKILSVLHAAKLSGSKLKVYRPDVINDRCAGGGLNGYPVITGVILG